MDRLFELLGRVAELSDEERTELTGLLAEHVPASGDARMDDEQLIEVHDTLVASFNAGRAAHMPDMVLLTEIADAVGRVRQIDTDRTTLANNREVVLASLAERVGRPARTPLGRLNRHLPAQARPNAAQQMGQQIEPRIIAVVDERMGQEVTLEELSGLIASEARGRVGVIKGRQRFARLTWDVPEEARLSPTDSSHNRALVAAAVRQLAAEGPESLVAAGGLCAPLTVRYEQDVVGTDARYVRDALARFPARGGVRWIPSPTIEDIGVGGPGDTDAAVGTWTMADDEAADPTNPGTHKAIQRLACGQEETIETYAVTKRLRVGNVMAMTWPERVNAVVQLVNVAYARKAESMLLGRIKTMSRKPTAEDVRLGSARDLVATWTRTAWAIRNHHRIPQEVPLRVIAPDVVIPHSRTDLARQLPGANHTMVVSDAEIVGMLEDAGIRLTLTPDLVFAPPITEGQPLPELPDTVEVSIGVDGTFVFIDSGELDLGFDGGTPVRDSGLNAVNDHELFAEGFEQVAQFGPVPGVWLTQRLCPSGTTSGTVDVTCDAAS